MTERSSSGFIEETIRLELKDLTPNAHSRHVKVVSDFDSLSCQPEGLFVTYNI
jgi:hypothetical protein